MLISPKNFGGFFLTYSLNFSKNVAEFIWHLRPVLNFMFYIPRIRISGFNY